MKDGLEVGCWISTSKFINPRICQHVSYPFFTPSSNIVSFDPRFFIRNVMPLSKPVPIRLSNNGIGNMANGLRLASYRLNPRVPSLPHRPQCLHRYSTAQQTSLSFNGDKDHGGPASKRRVWNPSAHGQVLRASDLSDRFNETEKTLGRLRIEASHGSVDGGINAKLLAEHLVRGLGAKPDMRFYSALILSNCREDGSVAEVQALIQDLRADGFDLDSSTCHDVLKVYIVSRSKYER